MKLNKLRIVGLSFCCLLFTYFANAQIVTINAGVEYQHIRGFGGMNMPSWINDLTAAQTTLAFGNGDGQLGLSILRVKVPNVASNFNKEYPTALRASALGAIVFASPWSPPAVMKSNNNTTGGTLKIDAYSAYADHLISFATYMKNNGAPLYAISLQNEPDIKVDYESCDWTMKQMISFLKTQGPKFDALRIIAPESFNFNRSRTDSILNDADAVNQVDIVGGHIYGNGLSDYPLARTKGKEVWMTEHYTESANSANAWPLALDVGTELHNCMAANFNAYIWWYIRRSYGLIDDSGIVTKRGSIMAQYAKFVRPGFVRISATPVPATNLNVTAYKSDTCVVVVVVNKNTMAKTISFSLQNTEISSLNKFTTSETKNVKDEGSITHSRTSFNAVVDAQSVTTFVAKRDVNNAVGAVAADSETKLKIYPNIATDNITLFLNEGIDLSSRGFVFNQSGALMSEFDVDNQLTLLNVSQLSKGIYYVKVFNKNKFLFQRFIKN